MTQMTKISRDQMIVETKFRKMVRDILEKKNSKYPLQEQLKSEVKLREFIKKILKEEDLNEAKTKIVPYDSTGIAVLADVIKKIVPIIKDDYFSLTTDKSQRRSFRAHIINAVKNSLAPIRNYQGYNIKSKPGEGGEDNAGLGSASDLLATPPSEPGPVPPANMLEQEGQQHGRLTTSEVPNDDETSQQTPDDERFIDIDPPEEEEEDEFSVPGEDNTGRNMALSTFKRIEKTIIDAYQLLNNKNDQEDFYDYIIANLKLYFDRWEDELQNMIEEPNSRIRTD